MERLLAVAAINTYSYTHTHTHTRAHAVQDGDAFMDGRTGCNDKQPTFQSARALKISICSLHAAVCMGKRGLAFSRGLWTEETRTPSSMSLSGVSKGEEKLAEK